MADDMLTELRALTSSVQDVRERVIKIEARGIELAVAAQQADISKLKDEVRALQDAENRRAGARGLFDWITKSGPGILMMIIIFVMGMLATKGIVAK